MERNKDFDFTINFQIKKKKPHFASCMPEILNIKLLNQNNVLN